MKIKLEISKLLASCLQRLIADEIDNQKGWYQDDLADGIEFRTGETRKRLIHDMNELADDLEKQGIAKHIKCY